METIENHLAFSKAPIGKENYIDIKSKEFIFLLLITFSIVIPYAYILYLAGMDQFDHKLEELLKNNKWLVAVLAIILAHY